MNDETMKAQTPELGDQAPRTGHPSPQLVFLARVLTNAYYSRTEQPVSTDKTFTETMHAFRFEQFCYEFRDEIVGLDRSDLAQEFNSLVKRTNGNIEMAYEALKLNIEGRIIAGVSVMLSVAAKENDSKENKPESLLQVIKNNTDLIRAVNGEESAIVNVNRQLNEAGYSSQPVDALVGFVERYNVGQREFNPDISKFSIESITSKLEVAKMKAEMEALEREVRKAIEELEKADRALEALLRMIEGLLKELAELETQMDSSQEDSSDIRGKIFTYGLLATMVKTRFELSRNALNAVNQTPISRQRVSRDPVTV